MKDVMLSFYLGGGGGGGGNLLLRQGSKFTVEKLVVL